MISVSSRDHIAAIRASYELHRTGPNPLLTHVRQCAARGRYVKFQAVITKCPIAPNLGILLNHDVLDTESFKTGGE